MEFSAISSSTLHAKDHPVPTTSLGGFKLNLSKFILLLVATKMRLHKPRIFGLHDTGRTSLKLELEELRVRNYYRGMCRSESPRALECRYSILGKDVMIPYSSKLKASAESSSSRGVAPSLDRHPRFSRSVANICDWSESGRLSVLLERVLGSSITIA